MGSHAASAAERMRSMRERRGAEAMRGMRADERDRRNYTFVGVDGEGGGTPHTYKLLRVGDKVLFHDNRPLTSYECLSFLADMPRTVTYVGYYFDYDATMILSGLPVERLQKVVTNISTGWSTEWAGFEIMYRPHKYFKVRRVGMRSYVSINDVGTFFQCRFTQALHDWGIGSADEWVQIEKGKDARAGFETMSEVEIAYNKLEVELLERLMSKFGAVVRGLKMKPRQWQGPGEIAQVLLTRNGLPRSKTIAERLPDELLRVANGSYFGGRFEVTTFGHVPGPIHNYDIRSAYPDAMRRLPCLTHGEWTHTKEPETDAHLSLSRVMFEPSSRDIHWLYGLPVRDRKGHISWPMMGEGWYWSVEIESARHQQVTYLDTWNYHKQCGCTPYAFVTPLYNERMALKAQVDGANKGLALKLALNSLYGKNAQSIGHPTYANPIYASLITALTRAKLYDMVHVLSHCDDGQLCGHNVYYLATDGILSGANVPVGADIGNELGQWEHSYSNDPIMLIASGLYVGKGKARTRGIKKTLVEEHTAQFSRLCDVFFAEGDRDPHDCMVEILCRQFYGLVQANHLNDWSKLGQWLDVPRHYTISWESKRYHARSMAVGRAAMLGPKIGDPLEPSVPYSKEIGQMFDHERILESCQPDESSYTYLGVAADTQEWIET